MTTETSPTRQNMQLRFVAGCVPILLSPFLNNPLQRIRDCPKGDEVCLNKVDLTDSKFLFINSRKNPGKYVFPKGGVKKREMNNPLEAALRETLEETGIEGEVFHSIKKSSSNWYLLSVKTVHDDWLEKDQRQRIWVSYEDISNFEPITKDTKKLIKKIRHIFKHDSDDESSSSGSDSD